MATTLDKNGYDSIGLTGRCGAHVRYGRRRRHFAKPRNFRLNLETSPRIVYADVGRIDSVGSG